MATERIVFLSNISVYNNALLYACYTLQWNWFLSYRICQTNVTVFILYLLQPETRRGVNHRTGEIIVWTKLYLMNSNVLYITLNVILKCLYQVWVMVVKELLVSYPKILGYRCFFFRDSGMSTHTYHFLKKLE